MSRVKIQRKSLVLTVQMIARRSEPGFVCFQVSVCVCVWGGGRELWEHT